MAGASAVILKSGEQPRAFLFGSKMSTNPFTTTNQASLPVYKESVYSAYQAILTGTGAVTATITIQVSNDDNTGRGYVFGNALSPGTGILTTNGSAIITNPFSNFTQAIVGATVFAPGVAPGTTVLSVTNATTATMSANATATTVTPVPADFYANNWCGTALGVITLTGTAPQSDGTTSAAPWRYTRAVVSGISGTGASVSVLMGV